ncbi:hypothetical protein AB0M80_12910 [Amycolatopsis sp. NPDC051045]|uniref:GTP pyrophosphokinase n=1 Tax=Amycolatopsis sp. NPDC051045 TaxID=3156922 RepID=UPI00343A5105
MSNSNSGNLHKQEQTSRRDDYDQSISNLAAMGNVLVNLISAALAASEIQYHTVTYRVKELQSAHKKIASRPNRYPDFNALTDLLGIRIVTYFDDDVDKVSELLREEFEVDEGNSIDKRANLDSDRFGYLSVHFILTLGSKREHLIEYERFSGKKFEVQIRSVLQHAWAEIEHDLGYKISGGIPQNLRRRFSRVAGLLESADVEFRSLRDEIVAYQTEVKKTINTSPQDLSINQDTLVELLKSNLVINELENMIVAYGGNNPSYLSMEYVGMTVNCLRSMKLKTVEDLLRYIENNYDQITRFYKAWIDDNDKYFKDEPTHKTPTGIVFWYTYLYWLSLEIISGRIAAGSEVDQTGWNNTEIILRSAARYADLD